MLADMHRDAVRRPTVRAALSNGTRATLFGDGRSAGARRYRDLIHAFGEEAGGFNRLTASSQQLVRRIALVSVELEIIEARRAQGREIDPVDICTLVNSQRRLLRDFERIKGRAESRHPSLAEQLAAEQRASRSARNSEVS